MMDGKINGTPVSGAAIAYLTSGLL